jgi:hypothetical protein
VLITPAGPVSLLLRSGYSKREPLSPRFARRFHGASNPHRGDAAPPPADAAAALRGRRHQHRDLERSLMAGIRARLLRGGPSSHSQHRELWPSARPRPVPAGSIESWESCPLRAPRLPGPTRPWLRGHAGGGCPPGRALSECRVLVWTEEPTKRAQERRGGTERDAIEEARQRGSR